MSIQAGDLVQVRSKEEILRSLDSNGRLEGMPFMPQMFDYCGQVFRVYKRAHKTCDTVDLTGGRRLPQGIHLDLRCDGKAYDGCQAACLLFWKEAWLKPVAGDSATSASLPVRTTSKHSDAGSVPNGGCTEAMVWEGTRAKEAPSPGDVRYSCQATELPRYTTFLPWWDFRQYVEDYTSGNASLGRMARGFAYLSYFYLTQAARNKIGRPFRWIYDRIQERRGGTPWPRRRGTIPEHETTPTLALNLQPGELVRVKSHQEILSTVQVGGRNRGLLFDGEMVPFCGREYRVKTRVSRFIEEKTGKMTTMKTPAVILDHVWCQARYSSCRMFCPRSIYSWWREAWLERVTDVRATSTVGVGNADQERARNVG
jgi:hypothetical protein